LAEALRANLLRRKAQARGREASAEPAPGSAANLETQAAIGKTDS
jgi:hypothetical protein